MSSFVTNVFRIHLASLLLVAAPALMTTPALADVAPPNACDTAGASCDTAGPNFDEPGKCESQTCSRYTPDGPMSYDCLRCAIPDGGTGTGGSGTATGGGAGEGNGTASGGSKAATGGSSSAAGAKSSDSSNDEDDGGCSVAPGPTSTSVGFAALTTFALAFAALRRRAGARAR